MSTVFYPYFAFFRKLRVPFCGKYRPLMSLLEIPFGIPDLHQGQPLRPCRCSRHFSILRRKDFFYFLRRIITLSNLKQCSGDNPHHIVEKTVSSDPEADQIVFFFQTRFIDGTDRVGHLRFGCCKAFKIMHANQIRCCLPHRIHIQRAVPEIGIQSPRRICKCAVQNPVLICFDCCGKTRVKVWRYFG